MESKGKVAVVDVGSSSIKLLVAERDPDTGLPVARHTATEETRISAGIGGSEPRLGEAGIRNGIRAIRELINQASRFDPEAIRIVATSAVRDAINRSAFTTAVQEGTGRTVDILSGEEEAKLVGAGLLCDPAVREMETFFQADLGGGSLELVAFHQGEPEAALSLPLGAVRLTEAFVPDPHQRIDDAVAQQIGKRVSQVLSDSGFSFAPRDAPLVGTGGTFVIARRVLAEARSVPLEQSSAQLARTELSELGKRLCSLNSKERAALPGLPANRADVMPAAITTVDALMNFSGRPRLIHSFFNLRYGVARKMLDAPA